MMGPALSKSAVPLIILPFISAGSANVCELSIKKAERVNDFLTRYASSHMSPLRVNVIGYKVCIFFILISTGQWTIDFSCTMCLSSKRCSLVVGRGREVGREWMGFDHAA